MSTKVFVGNLAFRTTDQALQEAFGKHGEVKSGVIITRGRRSLGYGFVEYTTHEQAAGAVDKMNKAEIFGRQIKVELAKDPSERPAPTETQTGGEVGPAKRRRRARDDNEGGASPASSTPANTSAPGAEGEGKKKRRTRRKTRKPSDENNSTTDAPPADNKPKERAPRPPREPREKVPSKTTLFVANLPFSIDDAALLAAFGGTKATSAHVVRTRTGRSRGYGFVEFANEIDQLEALKTANGKEITGDNGKRLISVTISNSVSTPAPAPTGATAST